jgi:hypothetical protein
VGHAGGRLGAGAGDPTVQERSYDGLVAFLERQEGPPFRVEVPFTDNHWESAWLGSRVPLARGWQRQLDRRVNPLFYDRDTPLTASAYRTGSTTTPCASSRSPTRPWTTRPGRGAPPAPRRALPAPVYRDAVWQVWEVRDAQPLAAPGHLSDLGPDSFTIRSGARGTSTRCGSAGRRTGR